MTLRELPSNTLHTYISCSRGQPRNIFALRTVIAFVLAFLYGRGRKRLSESEVGKNQSQEQIHEHQSRLHNQCSIIVQDTVGGEAY